MTDISDDAPLRLKDAVKIAFPAGGMTVSGLRGEITRGRLEAEMIAGKHFVTLRAINKMRELCRVEVRAPISFATMRENRGSSPIVTSESELAAALERNAKRRRALTDAAARDAVAEKMRRRRVALRST